MICAGDAAVEAGVAAGVLVFLEGEVVEAIVLVKGGKGSRWKTDELRDSPKDCTAACIAISAEVLGCSLCGVGGDTGATAVGCAAKPRVGDWGGSGLRDVMSRAGLGNRFWETPVTSLSVSIVGECLFSWLDRAPSIVSKEKMGVWIGDDTPCGPRVDRVLGDAVKCCAFFAVGAGGESTS